MLPPQQAIDLAKEFEGLAKLRSDGLVWAYLCPAGYPTQGYGIRVSSLDVPPITPEEAEERLKAKLKECCQVALRMSPVLEGDPARLSAICDFIFNLGQGAYWSSTLRKRINEQRWEESRKEIVKWVFSRNPVTKLMEKLPGLIRRREAEALLL